MPYKDRKKHQEWIKRYKTPYMAEYMRKKRERLRQLEAAVKKGDLGLAKAILGTKPSQVFTQPWQNLFDDTKTRKRRK